MRQRLKVEVQTSEAVDVLLVNPEGAILLAASDDPLPTTPALRRAIKEAIASRTPVISDIYRGQNGWNYVDVLQAVRGEDGSLLDVIVIRSEASSYLYPLIQSWPTPSISAETLLVQRDGDEVVFLSELRHRPHTALTLRQPLSQIESPAVQVALGKQGIFEGKDYHGTPVLSDLRPIPHSPWFIVAKVDSEEIFAEARYQAISMSIIIGLFILIFAGGIDFLNRQRKIKILQNLFESERQLGEAQTRQLLAQHLLADEQIKLQSTMADLERSNKELEQFAFIASHDLQEPLRMVSSYTQLLAQRYEGQLDDKAQKYIRYAVDGATRMQALINDLLAYSRVGTRRLSPEPTDPQAALSVAVQNLTVMIEESRAVITNDNLPTVRADAVQLALVFQNLLANAIKFRGSDVPHIQVSAKDRGNEWVFSVKDNGIGIEPQHADRVFVIFQRLHTRNEYPGTGIGLAVCQRIVERHGGKIWFESTPGSGTTFFFTVSK